MNFTATYRSQLLDAISSIDLAAVERAIQWFGEARDEGRHIFVCGNGGSAATASHFTCDIIKGASFQKDKRFRMLALNDSLPTLTAYANDVDYSAVFEEQLKNFAKPGDLVMAISGSGNSPNVVRAITCANELGCRTIALTGRDGGKLGPLAHLDIHVKSQHMGRIEDAHMIICHMICYHFMEI
ncbi:MAG TPA: SIS domain-containing protein [Bryobacteraceae bacterium]|jgi:D-sedoheptulose 7-phosphate isomerase|nr:SIS domain-containing protein [Bryobacteraceae bacterium]